MERELLERAVSVDRLRKHLRARMEDIADTVATGGCADWEQYKALTGEVAGLAFAERVLLDLAEEQRKLEGEDEE